MENCKSVPELLTIMENGDQNPRHLGYQVGEEWRHFSTEEVLEKIYQTAFSFVALGYKKGDMISIMSAPSPFWTIVDYAAMSIGLVVVPVFPNISEENFHFEMKQTGVKALFVGGASSWELVERNKDYFRTIVDLDNTAPFQGAVSFDEFLEKGKKLRQEQPDLHHRLRNSISPDDLASIVYTSGSTGVPKGVMLRQDTMVATYNVHEFTWNVDGFDLYLSILPLAHIFGRNLNFATVGHAVSVFYLQDPKAIAKACKELHPTFLTVVPRILEKVYAKMLAGVQNAHGLKKTIGQWAFDLANDEEEHFYKGLLHPVADKIVYSALREAIGGRVRIIVTGGAALNPHLHHFYHEIGLNILQGFGLTEACPLTLNLPGKNKIGTCGQPIIGAQLKIGENDEVLARGVVRMIEYYKNPEATQKVIDEDGWLHTGDAGFIDAEGFLTLKGRLKEMFKTSTGEYIVPVPIEQEIAKAPLIDVAVVVAEGRKYPTALLFPDFDVLASLKAAHKMNHLSDEEFVQTDDVRNQMNQLFETVNHKLNKWEKILDYRFVIHHLTIEDGDLTPSMKVRREPVEKKFAHVINSMYIADVAPAI